MNKFYLVICLLFSTSWAVAQENVLTVNAGFEDNDVLWADIVDDWLYKRWGESEMNVARNATAAHTGNYGISVVIASTGGPDVAGMAGIRREVTGLSPNATYRLKFFIQALDAGSQEVIVSIADFKVDPILNIASETIMYEGGAEWREVEVIFKTDKEESDYSQVRFDIDFRSNVGTYYVDDFSIVTTVVKTEQSITFPAIDPKMVDDMPFSLNATATSNLAIIYESSNTEVATISGNMVTVISDGTTAITASQGGDETYAPAAEVTQTLVVTDPNKTSQIINFPAITNKVYGDPAFNLEATSTSQLPITYTALTNNITISDGAISILKAGTAIIQADQSGNESFNAAIPVSQNFEITKANQTITIQGIEDKGAVSRPFQVNGNASSGLLITYSIEGPATIDGALITLDGSTGTVTVTGTIEESDNYLGATNNTSFSVISCDDPSVSCFDGKFYVSKEGSDNNEGTSESPFLSIQKAASIMLDGEECIISAGTYYETIVPVSSGVKFSAVEGEEVIVSGFDPISGWQQHDGAIYKASLNVSLSDQNHVMYDDQIMNLARWPNKTNYNPFDIEAQKVSGSVTQIDEAGIPDQNFESGGTLWFLGKSRWTSWRTPITSNPSGSVGYATLSSDWHFAGSHSPADGGEMILYNSLAALDSEGEWYINNQTKTVYFHAPGSKDLTNEEVMVRQRIVAFGLDGKERIEIEGIKIIGSMISMKNTTDSRIVNCEILHGNHSLGTSGTGQKLSFRPGTASIELNNGSERNTITNNNIQWGSGSGILVNGTDNVIINNYIGNFNYLGSYEAAIRLGGKNKVLGNEIFNAGRDLINGGGKGAEIGFNDMYASNLINDDCGAIYTCCGDYANTRIHHNWIHDISSRNENFESFKGCGVYLDNTTENVITDHNVIWNMEWTGIQINWAGTNLQIYNNTIWSNEGPESSSMGRWVNGYEFSNVPVYNTLANDDEFHYTELSNSVVYPLDGDPFEDFQNRNFMPRSDQWPIDSGLVVNGYTDGFIGDAPDVGAYERGKDYWVPGPDWELDGASATDCNGDSGGSASIDKCGVCSGGNTGVTPNEGDCPVADCHGDLGGTAFIDKCGACVEGNTGLTEETGVCEILSVVDQKFEIYPNPADQYLIVNIDQKEVVELRLMNAAGQLLMTRMVNGREQVDVSSLESGIYFYLLTSQDQVTSGSIIIQ